MRIQCKNTPISWLELERFALGESLKEAIVRNHLAECEACAQVSSIIASDERTMPALLMPRPVPATSLWWKWPAVLVPVVALLVLFWQVQREGSQFSSGVKGESLSLTLVRERSGVLLAPTHHAPNDRFKVLVTCAPGLRLVDLVIRQDGVLNLPIPTSELECGNATPIPGAFTLEGGVAEVCVQFVSEKDQGTPLLKADAICVRVHPEQ